MNVIFSLGDRRVFPERWSNASTGRSAPSAFGSRLLFVRQSLCLHVVIICHTRPHFPSALGLEKERYLDPVAEHGHARPAALGAGIERNHSRCSVASTSLSVDPFNGVGIDYALHIQDHGIARLQVLQPSEWFWWLWAAMTDHPSGGTELAAWSDLQAVIVGMTGGFNSSVGAPYPTCIAVSSTTGISGSGWWRT